MVTAAKYYVTFRHRKHQIYLCRHVWYDGLCVPTAHDYENINTVSRRVAA